MSTSIFLAQLIGPIFVLIGIGMLANRDAYRAMAQDIITSAPLIYISGVMAFLAGLAIVLTHNLWVADWRVIITLIGWLGLLRGATRVLLPRQSMTLLAKVLANDGVLTGSVVVALALGVILSFFGYFR